MIAIVGGNDMIVNIFVKPTDFKIIPAVKDPIAIPKSNPNKNVAIAAPLIEAIVLFIESVCKLFIPAPVPIPARIPDIANVNMLLQWARETEAIVAVAKAIMVGILVFFRSTYIPVNGRARIVENAYARKKIFAPDIPSF